MVFSFLGHYRYLIKSVQLSKISTKNKEDWIFYLAVIYFLLTANNMFLLFVCLF